MLAVLRSQELLLLSLVLLEQVNFPFSLLFLSLSFLILFELSFVFCALSFFFFSEPCFCFLFFVFCFFSRTGKSTLLDILSGRKNVGNIGGDILMNGSERDARFKRLSAYVTQEDILMATLTVYETLMLHVKLKKPKEVYYYYYLCASMFCFVLFYYCGHP